MRTINRLHDVTVEEISFVKSPANEGALFLLVKEDRDMGPIERLLRGLRAALAAGGSVAKVDAGLAEVEKALTAPVAGVAADEPLEALLERVKKNNAEFERTRVERERERAEFEAHLARVEKLYFPQPTPAPITKAAFGEEIGRKIARLNLNDYWQRQEAAKLYDVYLALPDDPAAPPPIQKSADELRLEQRAMVDPAAYDRYLGLHPEQSM